jgi:peptide/nickel transport system substrate-binding protein
MHVQGRRRWTWLASVGALVAGVALIAAGCGGGGSSSKSSGGTGASGGNKTAQTGRTFASFRMTWDAPDYFDPALSYTVAGWQIMWNVYLGLMGYKHVSGPEGSTLVPYLAQDMPKVSSDGKTYTFTLRPNLKYSNGKPVKASDFRYSVERDYKVNSPGVGFFSSIQGADAFGKNPKSGHITGIVTDDAKRTITIKLVHPEGDMLNILATEFTAFVPTGTPLSDQSTKGLPATGPYMITSYKPNRGFALARNPNFTAIPNVPKGNPDKVTATIIVDPAAALQSVLGGKSDYDMIIIPTDRLQEVESKYKDQLELYTPANTYYMALNNRLPPFNKLEVRQAVNYAIDRNAMVQLLGGLAKPTENILPPTYPSYKKIDTYQHDMAKAQQLVDKSGTKGQSITIYGHTTAPSAQIVTYVAGVLTKLGYKVKQKILSHGVYFTTIGNQATKAQIMYANWYQDYPNPIDWLDVLFNGNRITQTHNNNYSNSDFSDVNAMIEKLKQEPLNDQTNAQWAKVDNLLIAKYATAAPYLNRVATDFFSKKIDLSCYQNHVLNQFDFSTICMK